MLAYALWHVRGWKKGKVTQLWSQYELKCEMIHVTFKSHAATLPTHTIMYVYSLFWLGWWMSPPLRDRVTLDLSSTLRPPTLHCLAKSWANALIRCVSIMLEWCDLQTNKEDKKTRLQINITYTYSDHIQLSRIQMPLLVKLLEQWTRSVHLQAKKLTVTRHAAVQ